MKNVSCLRVRHVHQDRDTMNLVSKEESEESIEKKAKQRRPVDWRTLRIERAVSGACLRRILRSR